MILFDLIFGNNVPHTGGLFYKGGAAYDKNGGRLIIAGGGEADFGTYFNLFPYRVYREYCGVQKVKLELKGSGRYAVKICLMTKSGAISVLKTEDACDNFACETDISCLPDGGYLYFTVYSKEGCELYSGSWNTDREPAKEVNIGIIICTYNREKFVRGNLERLIKGIKKEPVWQSRLHAFVIDNAKTLDLEKSPYYTVIKNRNLGGSGGFARGMLEVADSGNYTHTLLMDDDIEFDFETIKRTWTLASLLTPEHAGATIGGSMLILENPCLQQEFGGKFDGLKIRSVNGKLDMSLSQNLINNENAEKPDFNAWWYCCMPSSNVKKYGLPMPFFIKCDDIEYGVRCGSEIICCNGVAIWHSDFIGKYNPSLEYYIKRNEAMECAMRGTRSRFSVALKLLYSAHRQLLAKDYACAEKILRGYEDFIKGSGFLLSLNQPEELNAEIMAERPQYLTCGQIEKEYGFNPEKLVCEKELKPNSVFKKALLFTENFTPAFLMKDKTGVTDAGSKIKATSYLKKSVIRYNSSTHTGYVCQFDAKKRNKLRRKAAKMFFRLIFGYGKIKKDYRENADKMCSRERWTELFEG
ncbi:MAG: glycosyltransferase [Clostridia bacterium]|nr:glycosyltransferase [Clostridia bacterium]